MRVVAVVLFFLGFLGSPVRGEICAVRTKVVGGWRAFSRAWPSFAELRLRTDKGVWHTCGGSVIAPEWVLTAGHCVLNLPPLHPESHLRVARAADGRFKDTFSGAVLQVVIGVDDLATVSPENVYEVADVVQRPDYHGVPSRDGEDIALVRLARPWLGPLARLSLSPDTDPADETAMLLAGFGDTSENAEDKTFMDREFDHGSCQPARNAGDFCAGRLP